MAKDYSVSDIKVMEGLEAVRMRPGMYIGSTGMRGLHHMLWEIVDNAVDEAANGYASEISITLHRDNSVTVEDNGRGIPVGIHEKLGAASRAAQAVQRRYARYFLGLRRQSAGLR